MGGGHTHPRRLPQGISERVEELRLNPNRATFGVSPQATFGQLAAHSMQHELPENQDDATIEKAYSTILKYRRYLKRWALPRWERTPALTVEPIEVERWLKAIRKIGRHTESN